MAYPPNLVLPVYCHTKAHFENLQAGFRDEAKERLEEALEGLVECEPCTSERFFRLYIEVVITDGPDGRRLPGLLDFDPIQSRKGVEDWMGKHEAHPVGWFTTPGNTYPWGKKWFWTGGSQTGRFPFMLSYAKTLPTMVELQETLRGRH